MVQLELYRSVLKKLSLLPEEYLLSVDNFLTSLGEKINKKKQNRSATLELAGSWSDLDEADFQDYLKTAKESGQEMFNREIEL